MHAGSNSKIQGNITPKSSLRKANCKNQIHFNPSSVFQKAIEKFL